MFFRVIGGPHQEAGRSYKNGEIIQTNNDLVAMFGKAKFEAVDPNENMYRFGCEDFYWDGIPENSDEAAFIRAIIENKEDDTARLVFADYLEENGRDLEAQFLRVQIALGIEHSHEPPFMSGLSHQPWIENGVIVGGTIDVTPEQFDHAQTHGGIEEQIWKIHVSIVEPPKKGQRHPTSATIHFYGKMEKHEPMMDRYVLVRCWFRAVEQQEKWVQAEGLRNEEKDLWAKMRLGRKGPAPLIKAKNFIHCAPVCAGGGQLCRGILRRGFLDTVLFFSYDILLERIKNLCQYYPIREVCIPSSDVTPGLFRTPRSAGLIKSVAPELQDLQIRYFNPATIRRGMRIENLGSLQLMTEEQFLNSGDNL